MLREVYGEVILKKGSILYHSSDNKGAYKEENKPMIFCAFHPYENGYGGDYVKRIKLIKDVSLFFMIEDINHDNYSTLISSLPNLFNHNLAYSDFVKNREIEIINCVNELRKERFDGWINPLYRKIRFEVGLINDNNIYKPIGKNIILNNYRKVRYHKNLLFDLNNKYLICTIENPAILNINQRFKKIIEKYINYGNRNICGNGNESGNGNEIKKIYNEKNGFHILLQNAIINYHEGCYIKINWENTFLKNI